MRKTGRRRAFTRAFTLVELLVVIGIIALLVSILLPTLGKARRSARSVACQSNLRTLAMSFLLYAHDNKGMTPPLSDSQPPTGGNPITSGGTLWYEYLSMHKHAPDGSATGARGYVNGVWRCPEVVDDQVYVSGSFGWGGGYGVCSKTIFRYGKYVNGTPPARLGGPKLNRVRRPTDRWLIGDTGRPAGVTGYYLTWTGTFVPPFDRSANGSNQDQPACRHSRDSANVAMFDGHVESVTYADLNKQPIGENRFFPSTTEADSY
jgi:prepilin-type processing-associated H-X9-DG protein/prepilin-type N-terminal cleavage/methylation domain-containing protein